MEISIDNLETLRADMLQTFGKRANSALAYITSCCESEESLEIATDKVHPLGRLLYDFKEQAQRSQRSGKFEFSHASYNLLNLYEQVSSLASIKGSERILEQLDHERYFRSSCFEVAVANAYLKSGWDIEIIEEGDEKRPDFIVRRDGRTLLIECKSLEDKQIEAERAWNHFARLINRLAERIGWQFCLKIVGNDYINQNQANDLLKFIEQKFRPNESAELTYENLQISVQWGPKYETEFPVRKLHAAIDTLGRVEFSWKVKDGIPWLSGLTAVDIKTHFSTEMSGAAINLYKKAKKQLSCDLGLKNAFAILHLEAPHDTAEGFATVSRSLYDAFAKKIQNDKSAVDAVVISTFSDKYYSDKNVSLVNYQDHIIVPSFRSNEPVCDDVLLLGSGGTDSFDSILNEISNYPSEGTIVLELFLEKKLVTEVGSYIFKAVSGMGDYQLRISVLTQAKLRFEVINPMVYRLKADVNIEDILRFDSLNKICCSFTKDVLKVAINGRLLRAD